MALSPAFRRRYGAYAERAAAAKVRTYGHLAIAVATELYDTPGDLEPYALQFLRDIRSADARRSESLANARRLFGFNSTAYLATERLASNQRDDDYQRALDKYELAVEATDQLDEIDGTPELRLEQDNKSEPDYRREEQVVASIMGEM